MRIVKGFPPNYSAICAAIPAVKSKPGIIFTYGNTIYCPMGNTNLPDHLEAHEATHSLEQDKIGVDEWWARYLRDPRFRLEQELLAYQVQYRVLQSNHSRAERKFVLSKISKDLGGAMYGKIVDTKKARQLITLEVDL